MFHLGGFGVEDLGCLLQAGSLGFAVEGLGIGALPGPECMAMIKQSEGTTQALRSLKT